LARDCLSGLAELAACGEKLFGQLIALVAKSPDARNLQCASLEQSIRRVSDGRNGRVRHLLFFPCGTLLEMLSLDAGVLSCRAPHHPIARPWWQLWERLSVNYPTSTA
jgi:hypothetical protein